MVKFFTEVLFMPVSFRSISTLFDGLAVYPAISRATRQYRFKAERICIRSCKVGVVHYLRNSRLKMNIKAIVHEAEEGGFWAEVPAIPGCATQGDSLDELLANLREAIEGCLSVDIAPMSTSDNPRIYEIAV